MPTSPDSTPGPSPGPDPYHLVVVPEVGEAAASEHATLEGLSAAYSAAREGASQVFIFRGARLPTSRGGTHLWTPEGWEALDVPPPPTREVDPGGWAHPRAPAAPPPGPPAAGAEEDDDDEEEDEDEDDDGLPSL